MKMPQDSIECDDGEQHGGADATARMLHGLANARVAPWRIEGLLLG